MDDLQTARDLRAATDYLRTHGWIQGRAHERFDGPGAACVGGAICEITGARDWIPVLADCTAALGLRDVGPIGADYSAWGDLPDWNDQPGRTLDEVLDRLESTALALEVRALSAEKETQVELAPVS